MKRFLITAVFVLASAFIAQAQTIYQFSTTISSSTWLTPGNWTVGPGGPTSTVFPGVDGSASTTTDGTSTDIATFGSLTSATPASNGINFNTAGGSLTLGAIQLLSSANRNVSTGNSSGAAGQPNPALLTLNGGTLNSIANTILSNESAFSLTIKPFQGGSVAPMNVVLGNATDNVVQVNGTGSLIVSSVIQNGAGNHLTVTGTGAGAVNVQSSGNTYTGGTTVSGATFLINNTAGSGTGTGGVTVNAGIFGGGTAASAGFVNVGGNTVTVNSGGTFAPGSTVALAVFSITGTQTAASAGYTSTVNIKSGATFQLTLGSLTNFSKLNLTGTLDVTGSNIAIVLSGGYTPNVGDSFQVVTNDGSDAITGAFAQGIATAGNGQTFSINYTGGDGNDLVLTTLTAAIPEPATYMLIGLGVLVCGQQIRRRKKG